MNFENSPEDAERKPDRELRQEIDRETVERYFDGLGISEEELRGKKVLDVGCHKGDFIRHLLESGVTDEAYGLDLLYVPKDDRHPGHFMTHDFRDPLPVRGCDMVVSVGAATLFLNPKEKDRFKSILENALDAITETGEVRIFPVLRDVGNGYEGLLEGEQTLDEVLDELQNERGVVVSLSAKEIVKNYETGKDDHEQQLLVLRKGQRGEA